ncbi:MAG TPA: HAMP domain-containing sensor histidine kinase [Acidimicrobiales bacterium]|nr:HAMP domain-containing sensor histidine kinase [Acidimicrobiales bacterium]
MKRRLTVAILGVVIGALAVAGVGSLLLVRRAVVNQTRDRLVTQARVIAGNLDTVLGRTGNARNVLKLITDVARLEDTAITVIQPGGQLTPIVPSAPLLGLDGTAQPLPSGLSSAELHPAQLLAGRTVTGRQGGLVFAAVPTTLSASALIPANPANATQSARATRLRQRLATLIPNGSVQMAVIVTGVVVGAPGATSYFIFAGLAALLVAALVAERLGQRIIRPLRDVETAARRIAGGDLTTRLSVAGAEYPELASLAGSINSMTASLERSRGLERQFFMSISHDLRTPLTSIKGWAEAIADGATDGRRAADVIGAEARRLERLVQDLLDLAKLDSHAFSLHLVPTDITEVVADTAESLRPSADEAGISLEVQVPDVRVEALADPDRLAQVVANLVENAYKFARSRIRVAAGPVTGGALIGVEDDGPGIPAEDLAHVFERLHQSGRTPARQAGSGLGLAIVKELTEAMGATVRVDSPVGPDGGTRMVVALMAGSGGGGDAGGGPAARAGAATG